MKRSLFIALAIVSLGLLGLASFNGCSAPSPDLEVKTAIIDQLYVLQPNQAFIDETTEILEGCGFKVDVWLKNIELVNNSCNELLIERHGFSVTKCKLTPEKHCPLCQEEIPIIGALPISNT